VAPAPHVVVAKQLVPAQPVVQRAPPETGPKPAVADTRPAPVEQAPEAQEAPVSEFDALMARAKAANGRKAFRTAAASYRQALDLQPDSLEAKAGLGIALVNGEGSYVDAAKLLSDVVKVNDHDERAWLALGMAYQFNGDQDSAFKAYRKYLEIAPNGESARDVRMLLQQPSN
jgi:Tfp pilus assembly protein PilF